MTTNDFYITAIIPVLDRPKNVKTLIESFFDTTPPKMADMLFVTGECCKIEIDEINKYNNLPINIGIAPDDVLSWAKRINWGINYSKNNHHFNEEAPWLLCGADDLKFHQNWFEVARDSAKDFVGIIGNNDLGNYGTICGTHTTHPIVSRKYIEEYGTIEEKGKLCNEEYEHNYVDVEFIATAKKRNAWKHEKTCIIEHLHHAWKKADYDDIYKKGDDNWKKDELLWIKRSKLF